MNVHFSKWDIDLLHERIPMRYKTAIDVSDEIKKKTVRRLFRSDLVPEEVTVNVTKSDADELLGWIMDPRVLSCYTEFEKHTAKLLADKLRQVKV